MANCHFCYRAADCPDKETATVCLKYKHFLDDINKRYMEENDAARNFRTLPKLQDKIHLAGKTPA